MRIATVGKTPDGVVRQGVGTHMHIPTTVVDGDFVAARRFFRRRLQFKRLRLGGAVLAQRRTTAAA
jgi:hypothetical protein